MIRRPPRSTRVRSSAASDVYKRQAPTTPRTTTLGLVIVFFSYAVNGSWATGALERRSRPTTTPSSSVGAAIRAVFRISACRVVVGAGVAAGAYQPRRV